MGRNSRLTRRQPRHGECTLPARDPRRARPTPSFDVYPSCDDFETKPGKINLKSEFFLE